MDHNMKDYINKFFLLSAILVTQLITSCAVASDPEIFNEHKFKIGGNGIKCLGEGWHDPEPEHVWSAKQYVSLNLEPYKAYLLNAPRIELALKIGAFPWHEEKEVNVTFQKQFVGSYKILGVSIPYFYHFPYIFWDIFVRLI